MALMGILEWSQSRAEKKVHDYCERINPGVHERIHARSDRELAELAEKYDTMEDKYKTADTWQHIRNEIQKEVDSRSGFPYDVAVD